MILKRTSEVTMLKVGTLLAALALVNGLQNRQCANRPGLTFTPCSSGNPEKRQRWDVPPPNYPLVDCCKVTEYSGTDPIIYEFHRGEWDLVILCATMEAGKEIEIPRIHCEGGCKNAKIDGTATYPLKIPMRGPRFSFRSEGQFSVKFFATNNEESGCTCGSVCENGWLQFGDNCYKRMETTRVFNAQGAACEAANERALLASVHSFEEQQFIKNEFIANVPQDGIWLGLHDVLQGTSPRKWVWTDCSAYDYTNWHHNEPNNAGGAEDCLELRKGQDFNWNDIPCHLPRKGVCKYYLPPIPPNAPTTLSCCSVKRYSGSERACYRYLPGQTTIVILCARMEAGQKVRIQKFPCAGAGCNMDELDENTVYPKYITANIGSDFTFYSDGNDYHVEFMVGQHTDSSCSCSSTCMNGWKQYDDYCYLRTSVSKGFHDMDEHCYSLRPGAHLASVHSNSERDFIKTEFTTNTNGDDVWIGLHDVKYGIPTRTWRWTDCTSLDYTNWNGVEPNDSGRREDCVHMFKAFGYRWNDVVCSRSINGVCKYLAPIIES